MATTVSQSVEHATLVEYAEKLASGISADPLVVANKLLEARLAPPKLVRTMLLQSIDNYDKATKLVLEAVTIVESYPEKFRAFMNVLSDFLWLRDLVESVQKQYETNKRKMV